jgi:hypothetical protein
MRETGRRFLDWFSFLCTKERHLRGLFCGDNLVMHQTCGSTYKLTGTEIVFHVPLTEERAAC